MKKIILRMLECHLTRTFCCFNYWRKHGDPIVGCSYVCLAFCFYFIEVEKKQEKNPQRV